MLTGKELGQALKKAMVAKKVVQREVAAEFGITQPSVSEWVKHGRIDKAHINRLVAYFSDVVRPSHWGLPDEWGEMPKPDVDSEALRMASQIQNLNAEQRRSILALLSVYQPIKGVESSSADASAREPKQPPPPAPPQPGETPRAKPSAKRAR